MQYYHLMNDIVQYNPNTLLDEQIAAAELMAAGVPMKYIAKKLLIPVTHITLWKNTDASFIAYLEQLRQERQRIIDDNLTKVGALAFLHAEEILTSDPTDINEVKIKADMAKSVMSMISSKKVDVKVEIPVATKLDNIDPASKAIVSKHQQPNYVVVNNVEILEDEPILFKDCKKGVLNINSQEGKIQCHICGGWYDDFVRHIRLSHDISPPRYRSIYDIPEDIPFYIEPESIEVE